MPKQDVMPDAVTKQVSVRYLPLDTPADMGNALDVALEFDYRGKVEVGKDQNGNHIWYLELNGPGNPQPVVASLGDVLVWDGIALGSMKSSVFDEKYTRKSPPANK